MTEVRPENKFNSDDLTIDRLFNILSPLQKFTKIIYFKVERKKNEIHIKKFGLYLLLGFILDGHLDLVGNIIKISMYIRSGRINEAQQVTALLCSEILCLLRGIMLLLQYKKIAQLYMKFDQIFPKDARLKQRMRVAKHFTNIDKRFRYLNSYISMGLFGFITTPLVRFLLYAERDQPLKDEYHMHASWLPFRIKERYNIYPLTYFCEAIVTLGGTFYLSTWDHAYSIVISLLRMHFEYLNNEIRQIKAEDTRHEQHAAAVFRKMRACMAYQQKLISLAQEFNDIFGVSIMLGDAMTSAAVCFCVYLTVNTPDMTAKIQFVLLGTYFLIICFEIARQGSALADVTSSTKESIYDMNWYEGSIKFRKYIISWLQYSNKPFILTGFKIYEVNMEHFQQITMLAYEMLTFLQSRRTN